LPTLAGELTAESDIDATVVGSLPSLGGQLTGEVIVLGQIQGALPTLGGTLETQVLGVIEGEIGGALPTLGGSISLSPINTVRQLIFSRITSDNELQALGFDQDNVFTTHDLDTPQRRPLMILRWQNVVLGVGPVNQRLLQVWVHDRPSDYERIDQTLKRLRTLISSLEAVRLGNGATGLHTAIWEGDSDDLRDDEVRTITRWGQFRLTGSDF
jgi:hypothetical protein